MLLYCFKCKKKKDSKVAKKNKGKLRLLSKCVVCDTKTKWDLKNQEPTGLLSNLGVKTSFSKFPYEVIFCF